MSAIRSLSGAKRTSSNPHPRCSIYKYTPSYRLGHPDPPEIPAFNETLSWPADKALAT
jgi:hypothetical protein